MMSKEFDDEAITKEEIEGRRSIKELNLHIQKLEKCLKMQQNEFQNVEMEKAQISKIS